MTETNDASPEAPKPPRKYFKDHSEEELKDIARDMAQNKIFTSLHIKEGDESVLGSIFLMVGLGGFSEWPIEEAKKVGIIYEYYEKAGPRSVNGYPSFLSVNVLTIEQSDVVMKAYSKIMEALKNI